MKKRLLIVSLLTLLCACASEKTPMPEPVLTQLNAIEPEPVNNPASLFEAGQSDFLFDDNRANKVGDIVMVLVTETTNGDFKFNTTAQKANTTALGITAFPGTGLVGAAGKTFGLSANPTIGSSTNSNFSSTGESKQEAALTTTVAVRVIRMLPGKVMQVEGARQIRVNAETQILVVRGLVRQRDIDSKNTVPSAALADAKIEVYGQGMLSDKQRGGWLSRLLDNVWPF